jgi:nicotinamidase-related amidase
LALPSLIVIDVQKGFDDPAWGPRNNPAFEERLTWLISLWRERGAPVLHVRHDSRLRESPLRPGQCGNAFKACALPLAGEVVIPKAVNSAFIGTSLAAVLAESASRRLVLAGLTTDHCVSTTARMAGNLGYETYVVSDATATFARRRADGEMLDAELVHQVSLASLDGEFATVLRADRVDAAWGARQ